MPITLRSEKGAALTYGEMDENFRIVREEYGLERVLSIGNTANNSIDIGNNVINSSGAIVQQAFVRIGPERISFSSVNPILIPGLSISFTPRFADSTILIEAILSSSRRIGHGYAVFKDGSPTVSTAGFFNVVRADMQITTYDGGVVYDSMTVIPIMHYESAENILPRTYGIYGASGGGNTLYINNRGTNDTASFSYMTVKEFRP